jgi:TonB-dependent starch-binding outer membrane protein SusC
MLRKIFNQRRKMYITMLCIFLTSTIVAQTRITGKVTGVNNEPVAGASVKVKGTSQGTATLPDGSFSITGRPVDVLEVTSVGFVPAEVTIGDQQVLSIVLTAIDASLNEVVVTGYTSQRKKDLTGAVAIVNVADLNKQPTGQVASQLQGQASGVTVLTSGQPGEQPRVSIRGLNTFGNNTPLYVVDGVPTDNLNDINPNDIASIQVMKDAGAASIYGSRASNGVLIITTKRGTGKVKVQYSAYYGTQRPKQGNVYDILSPQEMADLQWSAFKNSGLTPGNDLYGRGATPVLPDYIMPVGKMEGDPLVDPALYNVNPLYTSAGEFNSFNRIVRTNKQGTDWYHEIFKPAPINSQNISVSGGGPQGNYLLSLNYLDQEGMMINTGLKRYGIRANSQFHISKRIRIGENLSYTVMQNLLSGTNAEGSAVGMAFRQQPIIPVHDIMGNYAGTFTVGGQLLGNSRNPVAIRERVKDNRNLQGRLFGNIYAEIDLLNDLTFRSSFGGDYSTNFARSFTYPEYENAENSQLNAYNETSGLVYNWVWTNTFTYSKEFKNHNFKLLAGTESLDNSFRSQSTTVTDYFSFDPNFTTLGSGTGTPTATSSREAVTITSYFGRLDYTFRDKYLLGAVIRRDGSSKFLTNTYGWFPAVSLGWRMSDENFMKGLSWLTDFKLRGSWGVMGNQNNVAPPNSFFQFGGVRQSSFYDITGSNSNLAPGVSQVYIGNPDARWEKNVNVNFGFDASLFNGKLNITADYYRKDIQDLLYNPTLPGTAGNATQPYINIASMKNAGFDASVTGNFDLGGALKLTTTATITTYKNTITKVSNISNFFGSDAKRFGIDIIRNQVGSPISSFYGYKIEGFWDDEAEILAANTDAQKAANNPNVVYQNDVAVGRFKYADVNGDGRVTDNDRTILGNANADFSYGLNIGLTYKNFDFSIFFYGVQGNEIWNQTKWWTDFYQTLGPGAKSNTALYNSWTPQNRNAKVAIQETVASFSSTSVPNSYYVENGSYLRARNAQLGYNLPKSFMGKSGIQSLRIYLQAANFFTITNYGGIDPEVTGAATNFGIDEGGYAQPRQFLIGVNLQF